MVVDNRFWPSSFCDILLYRKNKNRPVEKRHESPMNILKNRCEKGEITKEGFENQEYTFNENR
ncbi:hypothetical protein SAMN05878281_1770 [Salegentibacter salegens]|uniref:Uncharacterized protein n=1 Tax=Salegentibacter salegens TaxID=143223 RepID=A0A1M7L734_9FLAO|nr:hypothetical protein LY58_02826 [Salegentibacter salegens]SHM73781.1 hypothetical protein SAMN05878281_1770 [Salegentibacter salegens]